MPKVISNKVFITYICNKEKDDALVPLMARIKGPFLCNINTFSRYEYYVSNIVNVYCVA
jgi:hypothetical protein